MMETTAIHVSKEAYNRAARYAQSHNTSVEKVTERLFFSFFVEEKEYKKLRRPTHYSPELMKLVGIAKGANISAEDLNADEARWEYLKEKYQL